MDPCRSAPSTGKAGSLREAASESAPAECTPCMLVVADWPLCPLLMLAILDCLLQGGDVCQVQRLSAKHSRSENRERAESIFIPITVLSPPQHLVVAVSSSLPFSAMRTVLACLRDSRTSNRQCTKGKDRRSVCQHQHSCMHSIHHSVFLCMHCP